MSRKVLLFLVINAWSCTPFISVDRKFKDERNFFALSTIFLMRFLLGTITSPLRARARINFNEFGFEERERFADGRLDCG